jgi:hypothetical protein
MIAGAAHHPVAVSPAIGRGLHQPGAAASAARKIKIIHPNGRSACPKQRPFARPPRAPMGNDG